MMLLIDIGNSTTEFATYDPVSQTLGVPDRLETAGFSSRIPSLNLAQFSTIVVSSVVPAIDPLLAAYPHVVFVNAHTLPLLKLNVTHPEQVGADRLVNAVGAFATFQGPVLVIDSGTATTFCYVSKDGTYQGGAIFPGMGICSKALNLFTAKIPVIHVQPIDKWVGKNTEEAVQIGLFKGFIEMINGMIAFYKKMDSQLKIVGTGKGLEVLSPYLHLDHYDPLLIFKGLSFIAKTLVKNTHCT